MSVSRFGAVAVVVALFLAVAPGAYANHIAGATYNGTVAANGSSMSFTVSGDGSGITSFSTSGPLPGSTCTFSGVSATYTTPLAITNHAFTDTTPPLTFSGAFPGTQSAQGTLRMKSTFPSCDTGDLAWSAATTASPPPPVDTIAPTLRLSGSTSQRVLRQKGVLVAATCPAEACKATARGTVSVPKVAKVYRFKTVSKQIAKGGKVTLKLKMGATGLRAIKRALKAGKKLSAKTAVTAKDAAGNATVKKRTIRLKL